MRKIRVAHVNLATKKEGAHLDVVPDMPLLLSRLTLGLCLSDLSNQAERFRHDDTRLLVAQDAEYAEEIRGDVENRVLTH